MANFQRVYPFGAPFKGVFKSTEMDSIDARWPKIPNWQNGSDHTLDSGAQVTLGGDNTTSIRFDLAVGITYTLSIAPDAALYLGGTSGHPAGAIWQNYSEAIWESGSTATWQSGALATWASGSALVLASGAGFQVSTEQDVESGGKVRIKSGATLQVDVGGSSTNNSVLGTVYTGLQPAKNADPGADNIAISLNQIKAWGIVHNDGSGNQINADGMNVSSVVAAASNRGWTVAFARPMASSSFCVEATYTILPGGGENVNSWVPKVVISGSTGFDILLQKSTDGSYVDVSGPTIYAVSFSVKARQ